MRLATTVACLLLLMSMTAACRQRADAPQKEQPTPLSLTSEQCAVIRVAEQFVLENGYTSAPATQDRTRITWEVGDYPSQLNGVLKIRHDTLKPHAYGQRLGVPGDPYAWAIVFEYSDRVVAFSKSIDGNPREQPTGAEVRVKVEGGRPRAVMQHMAIYLSAVTPLPQAEQVRALCSEFEKAP